MPPTALVTTANGRPAVEVEVGGGKFTAFVPVTVGLFDDDNGLVDVHSPDLHAGQPVRLPTSTLST